MSDLVFFALGLVGIIALMSTAVLVSDAIERGMVTRWARARANRDQRRRRGDR